MITWRLKKGADRRLRSGHPWVFSNELSESPKGIPPGSSIELRDHQGAFLALGYGNPNSLIAFRALSFEPIKTDSIDQTFLIEKILVAWEKRHRFDIQGSFRLCFAENDELPGLIIDYYRITGGNQKIAQVLSYQISTAGMQKIISNPLELFRA